MEQYVASLLQQSFCKKTAANFKVAVGHIVPVMPDKQLSVMFYGCWDVSFEFAGAATIGCVAQKRGAGMRVIHFEKINRTREGERFFLDEGLAPKREMLGYRSSVEGVQSANASQLTASGGSDGALDKTILRLYASGQQMLMMINLFLEIATISKDTLFSKKDVLEILTKNAGKLKNHLTALETLSIWLEASRTNDNLFPKVGNIFSGNTGEKTAKNQRELVLLGNRVADATNEEKYRGTVTSTAVAKWSDAYLNLYLSVVVSKKNWMQEQKNNIDADKSQANNSMQPISAGIVASYNMMKKTLKMVGSVRSHLARF